MTQANYLDGNAAAGALSEFFAVDITAAVGQCNGCGRTGVFAEARLYVDAPGLVARCAGCEGVLLRVVTTPSDTYLDLRGLTYLRVSNSPG
ncbi:DUF6510 family protein [Kribbella speibonae]|uniref:Transcription factor zinc-finger domain-containing protein n=1 Tax=Kribbella speibonae TaxID=1572660 RepID=A0ABY2AAS5_9ACTN|nr:DUF6510 family protein [Kribbella speibonae]TCC25542.1 hypothetical protein E0H58_15585 [Kribbella speibonae]